MEQPRLAYFLIGTPRTGSSLLAEGLAATDRLGRPEEYFWRWQERDWAARFGLPTPEGSNYEQYVAAALAAGTTPNGVFGAKLFWAHLHDLLAHTANFTGLARLPAHERFQAVFGPTLRAVWLRRNCLRVAISLWRAEATGVWSEHSGDPLPPVPDELDVWRVTSLHASIHASETGWPHFLRAADIPFITVRYDEVVADARRIVQKIATFLQVALPSHAQEPTGTLRRQADDHTEQFIEQWTAKTGGCSACQALQPR